MSPIDSIRALTRISECVCEAVVVNSIEGQQVTQELLPLILTTKEGISFVQTPDT